MRWFAIVASILLVFSFHHAAFGQSVPQADIERARIEMFARSFAELYSTIQGNRDRIIQTFLLYKTSEDRLTATEILKKRKTMPEVRAESGKLIITMGKTVTTVEVVNFQARTFKINGIVMNFRPDRPLGENLMTYLQLSDAKRRTSTSAWLTLLLPESKAALPLLSFIASLNWRFSIELAMSGLIGMIAIDRVIWMGCMIDDKIINRPHTLVTRQANCADYYGDPKANTCKIDDNLVSIRFPNPNKKGTFVRVTASNKPDGETVLRESIVTVSGKDEQVLSFGVEATLDAKDRVSEVRLENKTRLERSNAKPTDAAVFETYEALGAVMRNAKNFCKDGMYDQIAASLVKSAPETASKDSVTTGSSTGAAAVSTGASSPSHSSSGTAPAQ